VTLGRLVGQRDRGVSPSSSLVKVQLESLDDGRRHLAVPDRLEQEVGGRADVAPGKSGGRFALIEAEPVIGLATSDNETLEIEVDPFVVGPVDIAVTIDEASRVITAQFDRTTIELESLVFWFLVFKVLGSVEMREFCFRPSLEVEADKPFCLHKVREEPPEVGRPEMIGNVENDENVTVKV